MCRLARLVLLGAVVAADSVVAQVRLPLSPDFPAYVEIAARYRNGKPAEAVSLIRTWEEARLQPLIENLPADARGRLRVCPELPDHIATATLDAAVLLHTDAALAALEDDAEREASLHFEVAQKLVDWLVHRAADDTGMRRSIRWDAADEAEACGAPAPLKERDWLLAVTLLPLRTWAVDFAERFAPSLAKVAPDDVEALHARGVVREAQAFDEEHSRFPPPTWRLTRYGAYRGAQDRYQQMLRDAKRFREDAADLLQRALAAAPERWDVRLRLVSVTLQLGRLEEAQRHLDRVLAGDLTPAARYLACLFLGRVAERQGRSDIAVRRYEQAAATEPAWSTAWTALAHAIESRGDADRARELLVESLSRAPAPAADPWSVHLLDPWRIGQTILDRLRAEVTIR